MKYLIILLLQFVCAVSYSQVKISARSPEILATYKLKDEAFASFKKMPTSMAKLCGEFLEIQLRQLQETDSWKMYSFYELLKNQNLMTHELVRVATVTELRDAIPQYTEYRKLSFKGLSQMPNGSILVADKNTQCGPDPLALVKGAYFMKCGEFLIGSGLVRVQALKLNQCQNLSLLVNKKL